MRRRWRASRGVIRAQKTTGRVSAACCSFSQRNSREPVCFRQHDYFFIFGHLQPFAQSLQQSHLQLQFGQSLQQSAEQQAPSLQVDAVVAAVLLCPAKLATTRPAASNNPPNNLTNIENSLS